MTFLRVMPMKTGRNEKRQFRKVTKLRKCKRFIWQICHKHRQNDGQILKKLLKYYKVKNFTIHNDLKIYKTRDAKACLAEAFFEQ